MNEEVESILADFRKAIFIKHLVVNKPRLI